MEDVRECIEVFNSTGSIPSRVLQAIMFEKPYYTTRFLRTLLSPSLPDSVDPSGLINALARSVLLPHSMHALR